MAIYEMTRKVEIQDKWGEYQAIEEQVLEARDEAGLKLMEQVMRGYEAAMSEKEKFLKKDRRDKRYDTLLGTLFLKRWRVREKGKGFKYVLDEWLKLGPRETVSPGLKKEMIVQCVTLPYEKATVMLEKISGVKRGVMTTWRLIQKEARIRLAVVAQANDWKKRGLPELMPGVKDPCPIIAIDPDATYVRGRRKTDKHHEVKLAVLYTKREPVKKSKGRLRWRLGQKQVVIVPANSDADKLFNEVTEKAVKDYGLHSSTRVPCHGDGDPWIKRLRRDYISQTLNRLDPYHLFKKMRMATGVEELPKDWVKDSYKDPDRLIEKIEEFGQQFVDKEDVERIEGLLTYLQNNRDGMKPSKVGKAIKKKNPRMYLRGSGPIESNVDWAVGSRFKRSRMNWSTPGFDNLSFLRMEHLNGLTDFKKVSVPKEHYKSDTVKEIKEFLREL